jgi:hypothetical protein
MIGSVEAELVVRFELCSHGDGESRRVLPGSCRWAMAVRQSAVSLFMPNTSREWTSESDPTRAVERVEAQISTAIEDYLDNHRQFLSD